MKRLLVATCLLMVAPCVQAQKKPTPLGVYVVLPVNDPTMQNEACWGDLNVVGITFRLTWDDIQYNDASDYNWTYFDNALYQCQHNPNGTQKSAVLSVDCGRTKPPWVPGKTITLHTLTKGTFKEIEPWDPQFQAAIATFIAAFGKKYDGNPYVRGISIWTGGYTMECFFAESPIDASALAKLGGPAIWLNAAESIAAKFANAFPTTRCFVATGIPDLEIDNNTETDDSTMTALATYCQSLGMGLQSNALARHYPNLATKPYFPHTTLSLNTMPTQVPLCRFQFLYPMGPVLFPNPKMGTDLGAVLENGRKAGARNLEVYPTDPTYAMPPGMDNPAVATFNQEVGAP